MLTNKLKAKLFKSVQEQKANWIESQTHSDGSRMQEDDVHYCDYPHQFNMDVVLFKNGEIKNFECEFINEATNWVHHTTFASDENSKAIFEAKTAEELCKIWEIENGINELVSVALNDRKS